MGLAGPPGAGKSTVAFQVVQRLNKLWPQKASSFESQVEPSEVALVLPMDGFHLYRYQLDAMEVRHYWLHKFSLVVPILIFFHKLKCHTDKPKLLN